MGVYREYVKWEVDISEFDKVGDPQDIGGQIVFRAKKNGRWFVILEPNKEVFSTSGKIYQFDAQRKRVIYKEGSKYISERIEI